MLASLRAGFPQGGWGAALNAWLEPLALQREVMPGVYPGQGEASKCRFGS